MGGSYSQSTPSRSTRKCDLRALTRGVALVALAWLAVHSSARAESSVLEVGRFSAAAEGAVLPPSWQPLEFKKIPRHTSYSLVRSDGVVVVRASSEASASGLVRRMRIDPRQYPVVQWRWKVEGLLEKGDVSSKKGDDYPARIYITFEYDPSRLGLFDKARFEAVRLLYGESPPFAAITYIWEGHAPVGTIVPNAYTDRVKMIVVESGSARVGRWVSERRDLLADYRAAFGDEPSEISGVAIMTDTDNTGESVTAYFGDIVFLLAGAL